MKFAVIQNAQGRPCGVIAHDLETGRTVIKCREADWPLQAAFDYWVDRPLIVQVSQKIGDAQVQVRKKVVRFDQDFLGHLLDRVICRPYSVRDVVDSSKSTRRLDQFLDQKAKEVLT